MTEIDLVDKLALLLDAALLDIKTYLGLETFTTKDLGRLEALLVAAITWQESLNVMVSQFENTKATLTASLEAVKAELASVWKVTSEKIEKTYAMTTFAISMFIDEVESFIAGVTSAGGT